MNIQELEARLQRLIEVQLISILPGQKVEALVIHELISSMQANSTGGEGGIRIAPNIYTIFVHPDVIDHWREPQILETLVDVLRSAGDAEQFQFNILPKINVAHDESVPIDKVRVVASHQSEVIEETKDLKTDNDGKHEETESSALPENAFLIVEGVKVFQLKHAVINIGRRLDNTLVVDDPRVSRNHTQIRAIKGRFVIFDLNSSGGTYVNGQRSTQSVLYPGDVISLAGVSLIFGQDNPLPGRGSSNLGVNSGAGADRSTAVIRTMPPIPRKKK